MQLNDVTNQINKLIIGQPANKNKFREHIERVIRELEKYRQYLLKQWQKAIEAKWVFYDKNKDDNEWTWILNAYSEISKQTYFTVDERWRTSKNDMPSSAQFYIKGKPKPDPLNYLCSMVWGSRGQAYKGLELLDYQFTLLAIIHDTQSWQAGRERIYFSFVPHTQETQTTTLSDRFCGAICGHLGSYNGMDVLETIEIALLAVKEKLRASEQKKDAGTNEDKNNPNLQKFEQDVQVVIEALKKCAEIIKQQIIYADASSGWPRPQNTITGLQRNAGLAVESAIGRHLRGSYTESPVREFEQILRRLPLYVPTANPDKIKKLYNDIAKNPLNSDKTLLNVLLDKKEHIEKLILDLQDYTQMARETDQQRYFDAFVVSAKGETSTKSFHEWAGGERVMLAIVFTDVVGSTALGEEIKDEAMNEVRRAHFAQSRKLIGQFQGREIKTIGDSFMAAFRSADKALDYAIALQSNTGHPKVQIRAGIHIGTMQVEEGDVFGGTVNFAARVVGTIKGAEIWLSDPAKEDIYRLGAQKHAKLKWERHDSVTMKGFPGVFTLWSLVK